MARPGMASRPATSCQPESFAKAADVAVQEAAKTIRGISGAHVVEMSATVEDGRISQYRTTVNIAFAVEH